MNRWWKILVVVAVLISGVWGWRYFQKPTIEAVKQEEAKPVELAKVTRKNLPVTIAAVGSLYAKQRVDIRAETSGYVAEIFHQSGHAISQGETIIQLDDKKAQAELDAAEADYKLAALNYQRAAALLGEQEVVAKAEVDKFKFEMKTKQAQLNKAKLILASMRLKAPFSGVIGAFDFSVGDYISQGEALLELVNHRNLKVKYAVPERYFSDLSLGQAVDVNSELVTNSHYTGKLSFISPTINRDTGTVSLEAELDNKDEKLAPGMFVRVKHKLSQQNSLCIPDKALVVGLDGHTVFVADGDQAHEVAVVPGTRSDGFVQILDGLDEAQVVITSGQQRLKDGDAIKEVHAPTNESI